MMVQLVPMTEADFVWYREHLAVAYAQNQVDAGEWEPASALQQSKDVLDRLLPDGLATKDHLLFLVMADTPDPVGQLWVSLKRGFDASAFILDIEIDAPYQRRGYGEQTLQALEALLKPQGIFKIGLHVHAHNAGARHLYEKMGYGVIGLDMLKRLDTDE
ncbi:MAG TPA: GNAT family N-acetyltransferase [Phototrophicaceae bacterium]|nr:GNAT family N-acetyltransferase [Phototrophicaceae bacterium]